MFYVGHPNDECQNDPNIHHSNVECQNDWKAKLFEDQHSNDEHLNQLNVRLL